ncbi:hypothetical protein PLANTIT3_70024 [Plantibacter sp. T3]|nr:hypothetical protein PLANTIT3_70024 [Plantibacter sp. T3]
MGVRQRGQGTHRRVPRARRPCGYGTDLRPCREHEPGHGGIGVRLRERVRAARVSA